MIYYTQIIYTHPDRTEIFHSFEDKVLPLLQKYKGELLYRIRPEKSSVIETSIDYPYEIHLISFESRSDFEAYRDDKERTKFMSLKEQSVKSAILIEGNRI